MTPRLFLSVTLCLFAAEGAVRPAVGERLGDTAWLMPPEVVEKFEHLDRSQLTAADRETREPSELGPVLRLVSPTPGEELSSPLDVQLRFERRAAPINLESFRLEAQLKTRIGLWSPRWNATPVVKGALKADGLEYHGIKVAPGLYKITVSLSDDRGQETSLVEEFRVAEQKLAGPNGQH